MLFFVYSGKLRAGSSFKFFELIKNIVLYSLISLHQVPDVQRERFIMIMLAGDQARLGVATVQEKFQARPGPCLLPSPSNSPPHYTVNSQFVSLQLYRDLQCGVYYNSVYTCSLMLSSQFSTMLGSVSTIIQRSVSVSGTTVT